MQIINTDGMSLIGPGSEWFWAAAQLVVVVVSLYGIYRQLRSQGAANAVQRIETLEGEWKSARMAHARLVLALHLKHEPIDEAGALKARSVLDFFVNIGNLYKWGFLSIDEIDATWGASIPIWHELTRGLIDVARTAEGRPELYELRPLIEALAHHRQRKGLPPLRLDREAMTTMLGLAIATNTAILEEEVAWQSGRIPTAPAKATSSD